MKDAFSNRGPWVKSAVDRSLLLVIPFVIRSECPTSPSQAQAFALGWGEVGGPQAFLQRPDRNGHAASRPQCHHGCGGKRESPGEVRQVYADPPGAGF